MRKASFEQFLSQLNIDEQKEKAIRRFLYCVATDTNWQEDPELFLREDRNLSALDLFAAHEQFVSIDSQDDDFSIPEELLGATVAPSLESEERSSVAPTPNPAVAIDSFQTIAPTDSSVESMKTNPPFQTKVDPSVYQNHARISGSLPQPSTSAFFLPERYTDMGLLGRGGMGEVRKVHDRVLKRNLAMKILHKDILSSYHAVERFVEEAQVSAQLQHPNILPIHDLGTLLDGRHYFTMKQVKGVEFS
ncbi:MAG: hypothetical protein VX278_04395, partial [Myxococcota bacterium]|nr:hypothetical protein [Myxococcota bacterium]